MEKKFFTFIEPNVGNRTIPCNTITVALSAITSVRKVHGKDSVHICPTTTYIVEFYGNEGYLTRSAYLTKEDYEKLLELCK